MKLREWLALRGSSYIRERAAILLDRYALRPFKAENRVDSVLSTLAAYGCAPTFPTPAQVVQRYPAFIRHVQDAGAEIAVHGYQHVDLKAYEPSQAVEQLARAAAVFVRHGIEVHGFRCPYLSCTEHLLGALPQGLFGYSSNRAIWWDVLPADERANRTSILSTLHRFYTPDPATRFASVPWTHPTTIEIAVSLPDDLQLHDGLQLGPEGMAQAWARLLADTHRRGELFVLQFHPELSWDCQQPFVSVLAEATRLRPRVWPARLRDVAAWWREKAGFRVTTCETAAGLRLTFDCSPRATVLARGLDAQPGQAPWDGAYRRLASPSLDLPDGLRPFVGVAADAPERTKHFLCEQGYIVETGEMAPRCSVYLTPHILASLESDVALVEHIENSSAPLVRYGRWPDGARSALCITGDLDALTLVDFAARLLA